MFNIYGIVTCRLLCNSSAFERSGSSFFITDEYSGIYWSTYWFELRITSAASRLTSSLARF